MEHFSMENPSGGSVVDAYLYSAAGIRAKICRNIGHFNGNCDYTNTFAECLCLLFEMLAFCWLSNENCQCRQWCCHCSICRRRVACSIQMQRRHHRYWFFTFDSAGAADIRFMYELQDFNRIIVIISNSFVHFVHLWYVIFANIQFV